MQHNEDGKVHLTYFIKTPGISFVWNGVFGDPIEVCPGGYGEPVKALIATDWMNDEAMAVFIHPNHEITSVMAWFQMTCDAWAALGGVA